ncbi:MAG: sensor histidine kinase [Gammaproteobacteria bacterium]
MYKVLKKPVSNMNDQRSSTGDGLFLPDFCNIRTIFVVVLIGELLAILLTLAGNNSFSNSLGYLGLTSFFILWIGLTSCAILCTTRSILLKLTQTQAGITAFLTILILTTVFSYLALELLQQDIESSYFNDINRSQFIFSNLAISSMISTLLLRYFYVQYHWQRQIKSEAESRIQALQSRIRPHFLFNSMNIIASLTRSNPVLAEKTVEDLADLFRASLTDSKNHTTWRKELKLSQQYLHIEKLRLDDRLQIDWQVDALPDDAILPALTLQPLLENAIYHGVEPLTDGGTVLIQANRAGDQLSLLIRNPISQKKEKTTKKGNQIAQQNVQQRLELFFQNKGSLNTKVFDDHYIVTISFPYQVSL